MTASVGGAGGSDALGLVLLLQYLNLNDIVVDCTVYEYELGWHTAVHALAARFLGASLMGDAERFLGDAEINHFPLERT